MKILEHLEPEVLKHLRKLNWEFNEMQIDNFNVSHYEYIRFTTHRGAVEVFVEGTFKYELPEKGQGQYKFIMLTGLL